MTSLPIPKIYWEALQGALQAQAKILAKDVATSLNQSEQPLLKVLASEKIGAYLFEEEGAEFIDIQSMRCQHPSPHPDNPSLLKICNEPILIGKGNTCPFHTHKKKISIDSLPVFRKIKIDGVDFLVDSENTLYTVEDFKACGIYRKNRCIVFQTT